jgi:hypothetical protein
MFDTSAAQKGQIVIVGPIVTHGGLMVIPAVKARFVASDGDQVWVRYDSGSNGVLPLSCVSADSG